ncbi:MAG: glutamate--tRNA ligase, partial [Selenomonadaceae bacterium]|nr:glutamate--tRNA ligase [Selenomonadaceae bacterium]
MKRIRTRFAPSPTGYMHIGNLRTALYAYLFAKSQGGDFILRIEDTDRARYVADAVEFIERTLAAAKIIPDEGPHHGGNFAPYVQSERMEIYKHYAEELVANGHAYYEESEQGVAIRQKMPRVGETTFFDVLHGNITIANSELEDQILLKSDGMPT